MKCSFCFLLKHCISSVVLTVYRCQKSPPSLFECLPMEKSGLQNVQALGYIRGSWISQFHSGCHITSLEYSMTSAQNYFVALEFAMDAASNLIHHLHAELFRWPAPPALFCCNCLKSPCDVHIFNGKVPANNDVQKTMSPSVCKASFPISLKGCFRRRWPARDGLFLVIPNRQWPLRHNWIQSVPGNVPRTNPWLHDRLWWNFQCLLSSRQKQKKEEEKRKPL